MKILLRCLLFILLLVLCCGCASAETDRYWKSKIETILENEKSNLLEMWNICDKNQIIGIAISENADKDDPRRFDIEFNNKKYAIYFDKETDVNDDINLQLNRFCELYSSLVENYNITDVSCYYWDDPKYNYMAVNLVDTTFYQYCLEYYPSSDADPEDVYDKEYFTLVEDNFYMECYTPGF